MHTAKIFVRLLALAGLLLALAAGAFAQSAAKGAGDTGTAVAGQKVAKDAQTGRLRAPTPTESRRLSAAMQRMVNRSTTGLTVVQHPNGMKSVNLQDRFQSIAVAKKDADGSAAERCVTNQAEARAFAKAKTKPTKNTAEVK